ncbi:MAG: hypothetical protein QG602_2375 [Verrucomicrobiota bacterium]|nr:hypothetical protein [Verrucomicrobiota bacterium]
MFAQALGSMPGFTVVGGASNPKEAAALCEKTEPDMGVLDINLGGASGLSLPESLREKYSPARVVIFSGITDRNVLEWALALGARGIVEKTATLDQLIEAVTAVAAARMYLSKVPASIRGRFEGELNQRARGAAAHRQGARGGGNRHQTGRPAAIDPAVVKTVQAVS